MWLLETMGLKYRETRGGVWPKLNPENIKTEQDWDRAIKPVPGSWRIFSDDTELSYFGVPVRRSEVVPKWFREGLSQTHKDLVNPEVFCRPKGVLKSLR